MSSDRSAKNRDVMFHRRPRLQELYVCTINSRLVALSEAKGFFFCAHVAESVAAIRSSFNGEQTSFFGNFGMQPAPYLLSSFVCCYVYNDCITPVDRRIPPVSFSALLVL